MNEALVEEPTIEQRRLLDLHVRLVIEENKRTNLTRIEDWESAQIFHVEDSLIGLLEVNQAPAGDYLDMGTGGGFPGIPLAIMTGRKTILADSVGKKTKALDSFISQLGIEKTVSTYNGRIEDLAKERPESFAVITARALSALPSLLELASPLLINGGCLVCYKAKQGHEELGHAQEIADKLGMEFVSIRDAVLSDGITNRCIIVFRKIHEPLVNLPRRVGVAQKRPY